VSSNRQVELWTPSCLFKINDNVMMEIQLDVYTWQTAGMNSRKAPMAAMPLQKTILAVQLFLLPHWVSNTQPKLVLISHPANGRRLSWLDKARVHSLPKAATWWFHR
jgi:hypothetical protein